MNQNESKRSSATNNDQYFFAMSTTREILTIPLLAEEALFTGHFEDEFHFLSIYKSFFFLVTLFRVGIFFNHSLPYGS